MHKRLEIDSAKYLFRPPQAIDGQLTQPRTELFDHSHACEIIMHTPWLGWLTSHTVIIDGREGGREGGRETHFG